MALEIPVDQIRKTTLDERMVIADRLADLGLHRLKAVRRIVRRLRASAYLAGDNQLVLDCDVYLRILVDAFNIARYPKRRTQKA